MVKIEDLKFDEHELLANLCRESFYEFVQEFWDELSSDVPVWNWHIKYLCDKLQRISERVFKNEFTEYDYTIINIPPGSTKTSICSIMLPAWVWTRMPSAGIINCAHTHTQAVDDIGRKNRDLMKSKRYQQCFPYIKILNDMDTKGHVANTLKGDRNATGVKGSVIGKHANFILIDDPIDPQGARSEADINDANIFIRETLSRRKKHQGKTPTIVIMQRLHQNDPTGMLLDMAKDGKVTIDHICLPAEKTKDIRPKKLRKHYKDGLLDTIRGSRKVLKAALAQLFVYGYAGQYLQTPIPLGGGMFKTDRITIIEGRPDKTVDKVRFWDKACTASGGAFTVGLLMSVNRENHFCIEHIVRGQWDTFRREQIIKETAESDGRDVRIGIEQEPGSGGKDSALMTVTNLAGWVVDVDKPSGSDSSKIQRAEPFSKQVNGGVVSMVRGEWNRDYVDEMKYAPDSTYKDQMDASSGAFNLLVVPKRSILVFH